MSIKSYMRSALAAAVVFISLLMSHAQTGTPAQVPEQTPALPSQIAPSAPQPSGTPEAQEPAQPSAGRETKPDAEGSAPQESTPEPPTPQQDAKPTPPKPRGQPASSSSKKATSKKPKKKPLPDRSKKPDAPPATPAKKVVANGGTSETEIQISPRMSDKQQADERQTISNLIWAAEKNLQKVSGRTLNDSQEEMAQQIRMYMEQSKQASAQGDLQRAKNLASKANLLSVELVGKE